MCRAIVLIAVCGMFPGVARASEALVDPRGLDAVACPSVARCVGVDGDGREVTFDPQAPSRRTTRRVDTAIPSTLERVVCPTVWQCTASDVGGRVFTFNPGGGHPQYAINGSEPLTSLVCPSTIECFGQNIQGQLSMFDPRSPSFPQFSDITLSALSCPTPRECIATRGATVITLDPQLHTTVSQSRLPIAVDDLSCPSMTQCTGISLHAEATFHPQSSTRARSAIVDNGSRERLLMLSCSTQDLCTAIDVGGHAIMFDPLRPGHRRSSWLEATMPNITGGRFPTGLSCPSRSTCTMVDNVGRELTFRSRTA
jgi:hypothetical protein